MKRSAFVSLTKVISAELRLKTVRRMPKRRGHHAGIRNYGVEGFALFHESISAGSYVFKIGKIKLNQVEASAFLRSVRSHLYGGRVSLAQIPRGAHNMRAMRR